MTQSPSLVPVPETRGNSYSPSPLLAQSPELGQPGLDSSASPSVASSHSFDQLGYPAMSHEGQDLVPYYPPAYGPEYTAFTSDPVITSDFGTYLNDAVYGSYESAYGQIDNSCQEFYGVQALTEFYQNPSAGSSMPYFHQQSMIQSTAEPITSTPSNQLVVAHPSPNHRGVAPTLPPVQRQAPIVNSASAVKGHRYNPMASPAQLESRRHSGPRVPAPRPQVSQPAPVVVEHVAPSADFESDDEETSPVYGTNKETGARKDNIKKQRIESEQRRRDELRDGYRRLKDALPPSAQKASKAALLDRATTQLNELNKKLQEQIEMVRAKEAEISRLQKVNEQLMLSTAEHKMLTAQIAAVRTFGSR